MQGAEDLEIWKGLGASSTEGRMKVKDSRPVLSLNDSEGEWNPGAEPLWKLSGDSSDQGFMRRTCSSGRSVPELEERAGGRAVRIVGRGNHGTGERGKGELAGRPGWVALQCLRHGG